MLTGFWDVMPCGLVGIC